MLRGSQTGVGGRKFAGCGYVDGGVRGILGCLMVRAESSGILDA